MARHVSRTDGVDNIQLDSLSTASDSVILAELAAYEAEITFSLKPVPGSQAYTDDLVVLCIKRNNGTWRVIR